jgi:hypothetical protein
LPLPACTTQNASANNNATLNLTPGYFCNGISLGNNATVNMAAGTYYIANGITIGNNGTIDATAGVSIVLTDSTPLNIANNATVNITAPNATSGQPYPGIAFMGLSTSTAAQTFSNNTTLTITGALYFPHDRIVFDNNAESGNTGCTQIIGRTISLSNNVNIDDSACSSAGTTQISFGGKPLVEE